MNVAVPMRQAQEHHTLQVRLGFSSQTGKRARNEDYVAALLGSPAQIAARGIVAAVADGLGGHKGGRQASELTIRSFFDGYAALPETLGVHRAVARALGPVNAWVHAQGRTDPALEGMATTLTALILLRRSAHVVHVGDCRLYRSSAGRLEQLTQDHTLGRGDLAHVLTRAVGLGDALRFDYAVIALRQHDRFLLCSDGVHGSLGDRRLRDLLADNAAPEVTAQAIVAAALDAGSSDNVTALVLDIVDLPPVDQAELRRFVETLPILALPVSGDCIDGFRLGEMISDGHYSRLFRAADGTPPRDIVLKFPHPKVAAEHTYRLAFVREAYVAVRVRSPWIGEIIEVQPDRQTRLYSVMPYYDGQTLEQRLKRKKLDLAEGIGIAAKLARALVTLHRAGIIHRDLKPDNVILETSGGLRLVDLGVARVAKFEDFPVEDIPGTPSYMAPELFAGHPGDESSDLYALGVTLYRAFSAAYPYGEIEPFSRPRFAKAVPLSRHRPDLPAWLDAVLAKATAVKASERFGDVIEFAMELENGAAAGRSPFVARKPLYQRNPVRFWQGVSALLLLVLLIVLARR